jgi:integrase
LQAFSKRFRKAGESGLKMKTPIQGWDHPQEVTKNPVEGLETSTKSTYRAIKITPAHTLSILRSMIENILHFTLVFVVAATALRSSEVLSLRWSDILWEERKIKVVKS